MDPNSIVDTLSSHGIDSSQANRATLYQNAGLGTADSYRAAGANNASQNTALNNYYTTGAGKPTSSAIVTSAESKTGFNNNKAEMDKNNAAIAAGLSTNNPDGTPKINPLTQNNDGTPKINTVTQNPDGSPKPPAPAPTGGDTTRITANDGTPFDVPKNSEGLAKAQLGIYNSDMADITSKQATINNLAKYDFNTDPNAIAAAQRISRGYDELITQTQAKNKILLGTYGANSARSGSLQYANEMNTNFTSNEIDNATGRIQSLITKRDAAIAKSNEAYKDGNVKALAASSKELEQAKKDTQIALTDLSKIIDTAVKNGQAQARIAASALKDENNNNIKNSTGLAIGAADAIANSGITDKTQIDDYINKLASHNGITNPELLRSAVVKAQQQQGSLTDKHNNIVSEINKRNQPKAGSTTFKVSSGISKVTPQMESIKGPDGYIDPSQWIAARTNWKTLGGSEASFNSNFKGYLNPASYKSAGFKTKEVARFKQNGIN
jgi:hypothetical protein